MAISINTPVVDKGRQARLRLPHLEFKMYKIQLLYKEYRRRFKKMETNAKL